MNANAQDRQEGASAEETRAQQIARLSNDRLELGWKEVEKLHAELDRSLYIVTLTEDQRKQRESLKRQVETLKTAFGQEYAARVLRGWQNRFEKLLQGLQPLPPQETGGRRLIPINAAVAAQDQEGQQDGEQINDTIEQAIQTATNQLAEQLRVILTGAAVTTEDKKHDISRA